MTQQKETYERDKGNQYKPRIVTVPKESDACAVCGFPIGTKKAIVHPDNSITHARARCRVPHRTNRQLQPA